ncbi:MAG: YdcF family protein [Anaerolineales bacterium]|nr:MAG: YdcF family protein [Anaerolineales bacterium]
MRRALSIAAILLLLVSIAPWLLRVWVHWRTKPRIYDQIQLVPAANVALVLGAGLWSDGSPTPPLHDRVATAVDLYKSGVVKKLLFSGDNRFEWYNEPEAMRQLAMRLGVPSQDIVLDYAGRRTYDSCYRAREIFKVERLVIVTQRFHLDRALYLCDALGIPSVGMVADRRVYASPYRQWWQTRELVALAKAWLDIHILRPQPVLGEELPIEIATSHHKSSSLAS